MFFKNWKTISNTSLYFILATWNVEICRNSFLIFFIQFIWRDVNIFGRRIKIFHKTSSNLSLSSIHQVPSSSIIPSSYSFLRPLQYLSPKISKYLPLNYLLSPLLVKSNISYSAFQLPETSSSSRMTTILPQFQPDRNSFSRKQPP